MRGGHSRPATCPAGAGWTRNSAATVPPDSQSTTVARAESAGRVFGGYRSSSRSALAHVASLAGRQRRKPKQLLSGRSAERVAAHRPIGRATARAPLLRSRDWMLRMPPACLPVWRWALAAGSLRTPKDQGSGMAVWPGSARFRYRLVVPSASHGTALGRTEGTIAGKQDPAAPGP